MAVYDDEDTENRINQPSDPEAYKSRPGEVYDDEDTENQASNEDPAPSNSSEALSSQELAAEEANPSEAGDDNQELSDEDEANYAYRSERAGVNVKKLAKNKWIWAGGAGGFLVVLGLLFLFLLLGQLKVVSFANVLSAAGYARFNGILQERTTQDIFDASVSQGEGATTLQGRTLIDRLQFRNLDNQLAELGRQDQFKLQYKGGELQNVKVGDQSVSLDGLTKDLGFGDSYSSASLTEKLRVRFEFTKQTQSAVNDTFALEPGYLRSRIFGTISDNVGFSFARWRQGLRDYFGKDAAAAEVQNKVETDAEVGGDASAAITTGVDAIDVPSKAVKSGDKLKAFLEKNGGQLDEQKFVESVSKDTATAGEIGNAVGAVAPAVIAASVACMAHEAFGKIPQIYNHNVQAAKRQGLQVLAARDQIKNGNVASEAVGAASQQLDGAESSPYYQAATGQPISSTAHMPKLKPTVSPAMQSILNFITNPVNFAIPGASYIPGVASVGDQFCRILLSPQGAIVFGLTTTVATIIIGSLTGGAGAAAEQGGSWVATQAIITAMKEAVFETASEVFSASTLQTVGLFTAYSYGLQYVVDMLAGSSISGAQAGADYYNTAAMGTMLEQNTQMQTLYGRPVTGAEAGQTDQKYVMLDRQAESNKGAFNRYISTSNPYSFASMALVKIPTTIASMSNTLRSSLLHISSLFQPQTYFSLLFHPSEQVAYAAAGFDPYRGSVQVAFSPDEQQKIENDPTYSIGENNKYLTQDQITQFDQKYQPCFSPTTDPYTLSDLQSSGKLCSAEELGQDLVFRYRLYKFDNVIADQLNQKLTNSSHNLSIGTGTVTSN